MKKVLVLGGAALALVLGGCAVPAKQADTPAPPSATAPAPPAPPAPTQEQPKPEAPALTESQKNAIESAESYLQTSAFSRKGLIQQLKYEKYSTADATYAVDHVTVDWNAEAAESAESYLQSSSFSKQGLIDQLKYEGFTDSQAKFGVKAAGL